MPILVSAAGGTNELPITVECHLTEGLPSVIIVGVAKRSVDEAKERIRAAFHASNLPFPRKRLTINLAPADIPKDGTHFDIGMAVAIMQASKIISDVPAALWFGELSLNGDIRPVRGIIGQLLQARSLGYSCFVIPTANLKQAQLVPGITIVPVSSLQALYDHLTGARPIPSISSDTTSPELDKRQSHLDGMQFEDIGGHTRAKRMLEIAAAGGHNILFSGVPGSGKSMLAKAFTSILPPLEHNEMLEVTHIHSLASSRFEEIITTRPVRAPHHSASQAAIIGGGPKATPGEISLAHRGVLFLDELPEYNRNTIEALRQPLEDRYVTVARANQRTTYLADFMLIATCNPCPCGYYGAAAGRERACVCLPHQVIQYQRRLSGPLLDRIDLYTDIEPVIHEQLLMRNPSETSETVRQRVIKARSVQATRFTGTLLTNAQMDNRALKQHAKLTHTGQALLNQAAKQLCLSARAYMRTIKVARTIADLSEQVHIHPEHIAEALQYRRQTTV